MTVTSLHRLIHVTDWLPTLYSAAGGDAADLGPDLDGLDQWQSLSAGLPSPREELLYNIRPAHWEDAHRYGAALRVGDLKLIRGYAGRPDGWIPPKNVLGLDVEQADKAQEIIDVKEENELDCQGRLQLRLFDLSSDPTERVDLAAERPEDVARLLTRLSELEGTMVEADVAHQEERFNPEYSGGVYRTGWCRAEPKEEEEDLAELVEVDVV